MTNYLLDNAPTENVSPYGCWNKERAINGTNVLHGSGKARIGKDEYVTSVAVATTVWTGSKKGEQIPCHYGCVYGKTDVYCNGCVHLSPTEKE